MKSRLPLRLERFHKNCSRVVIDQARAVFFGFGVVSAQSQGVSNLFLRRSLAKTQKIRAPRGYSFSGNALAGLLLLALLSNGCATKELWEQKAFREPSSPTHLKLAFDAARKDVLVVYDEINDRADVPQRRAYYLFQNVRRIERDRKPSFTDPGRAGSLPEIVVAGPGPFMPAQEQLDYCAKASTNSASFQLYAKGRQVGEFYLPVYKDGVWETQKALLTPLTLGADATVIGGVLGAMWISEGAPGAVH